MKIIFTGYWLNPVYPGALWPSKSHQVELEMRLQNASFPGESPTEQFPFATFQVSRAAPVGKCTGPLRSSLAHGVGTQVSVPRVPLGHRGPGIHQTLGT